ncbi:MAG: hypothetical protein ACI814_000908 [Mariniblastus sp.]|jgi:hypothetical protein
MFFKNEPQESQSLAVSVPPIDLQVPENLQTATFALG